MSGPCPETSVSTSRMPAGVSTVSSVSHLVLPSQRALRGDTAVRDAHSPTVESWDGFDRKEEDKRPYALRSRKPREGGDFVLFCCSILSRVRGSFLKALGPSLSSDWWVCHENVLFFLLSVGGLGPRCFAKGTWQNRSLFGASKCFWSARID